MGRRGTFFLAGLAFLFFAEGQRTYLGSLSDALLAAWTPALDAGALLLPLLSLAALLAPLVPLARWVERPGAVAVAAAGMAVFRLPVTHTALETRLIAGALVLAFFGLFLTWGVGFLERRALAAGAVAGLVGDQLLLMAGAGEDPSLQPAWLPIQVALSLALLTAAVVWAWRGGERAAGPQAAGDREEEGPGTDRGHGSGSGNELERRTGGLRLRAALALGAVLFLDLRILGAPAVVSRWTGASYLTAALLAAGAAAVALAVVLAAPDPARGRRALLALVAAVAAAGAAGWWWGGTVAVGIMAAGHGAALLLVARCLDPASGRRGGAVVSAALGAFVGLGVAYALAVLPETPPESGAAPWVVGAAVILLAGAAALLPRGSSAAPLLRPAAGAAAAVAVVLVAGILGWR